MLEDSARTGPQNKKFHSMVRDIAEQVEWAGERLEEEDWKRLILAGLYGQKVVPAPVGEGFVIMNNRRSRNMGKQEMADALEQLYAFGNDRGVMWSEASGD